MGSLWGRECSMEFLGFGCLMPSQIVRNQADQVHGQSCKHQKKTSIIYITSGVVWVRDLWKGLFWD